MEPPKSSEICSELRLLEKELCHTQPLSITPLNFELNAHIS